MSERELEVGVQANGPALIVKFSAMIRIARIHDVSNQAFKRQLQDFMDVLFTAMEEEPEIALVAVADYLYVNGARIRADASLLSVYSSLQSELARRSVGGIRFQRGVDGPELERFFHLFMSADDPAHPEQLAEAMARAGFDHVQVMGTWEVDADDLAQPLQEQVYRMGGGGGFAEPGLGGGDGTGGGGSGSLGQERGRAKQTFARAVSGTRRIMLHSTRTGRPDLRFAKRLVQPVVDNIMNHEYSIIGMTALKDHDEYTYAHCVNVSTLSVGMGHVLGIPRQSLADLGVAALIHDIGKVMVPGDVLRKPAKLTDEEWRLMRRHPIEGMKMMIRMPGLSTLALESMRTCLEHHMGANLSGYPRTAAGWEQGPMSRIVAMADCYDAMTAHRAYRRRPFTSYEALRRLVGKDRDQFDPTVRWAMIKTVGVYPPGSILAVDSGHVVLSTSPNPADPRRPNCKVLLRPDGTQPAAEEPENWDPMEPEHRVTRVLSPEDLPIKIDDRSSAFA
jgi:HD-GYP domain-containing protein (c-di-GMP phosphodiesterase class II)